MAISDTSRFENLRYEDFRRLAEEKGLSRHERIGFPDSYRQGMEDTILADIRCKTPGLAAQGTTVVDIGCGCGALADAVIAASVELGQQLLLVDAPEVLERLASPPSVTKVPGRFPGESYPRLDLVLGKADVVLAYSLLHYVVVEGDPIDFLDRALTLLRPGGTLLIGDVPNQSMRRRFFSSESGRAFHRSFTGNDSEPAVHFNVLEPGKIDDALVLGLTLRARMAGFDAWILPQAPGLPMANRREDLLFRRP